MFFSAMISDIGILLRLRVDGEQSVINQIYYGNAQPGQPPYGSGQPYGQPPYNLTAEQNEKGFPFMGNSNGSGMGAGGLLAGGLLAGVALTGVAMYGGNKIKNKLKKKKHGKHGHSSRGSSSSSSSSSSSD
ncbi:hypothetical protein BC833DRAFT_625623 [Globomyces pollinis-pini]|nr:hypothetical protein BC833DRAFT_625623 [Globomyces pollinis-pini]